MTTAPLAPQPSPDGPATAAAGPPPSGLRRVAGPWHPAVVFFVGAAAAWYLLKELAELFQPLFLAIFLCYVVMPIHLRLRRRYPGFAFIVIMSLASVVLFAALALLVYASVVDVVQSADALTGQGRDRMSQARDQFSERVPWVAEAYGGTANIEEQLVASLRDTAAHTAKRSAEVLLHGAAVLLYMIFLLYEAGRLPERVRTSFPPAQADQILAVFTRINESMASYLKVKVLSSLLMAVPTAVAMWAFGVRFALFVGALTFVGNFIPYLGGAIAWAVAVVLALIQLGFGWQVLALAVLVIVIHTVVGSIVEPALTGKAVNLSALVVLASLVFWSLCWGLTGMFLAVPLTVLIKIILENVAFTRPFTRLVADE